MYDAYHKKNMLFNRDGERFNGDIEIVKLLVVAEALFESVTLIVIA